MELNFFLLILQARFMRSLFLNIVPTKAGKPLARCDSKHKDLNWCETFLKGRFCQKGQSPV